ncbi:MAG: hypothetical protein R3B47_11170 [Bacteroidia bacterium]
MMSSTFRVLDLSGFMFFMGIDRPDLKDAPFVPAYHPSVHHDQNLWARCGVATCCTIILMTAAPTKNRNYSSMVAIWV